MHVDTMRDTNTADLCVGVCCSMLQCEWQCDTMCDTNTANVCDSAVVCVT